MAALNTFNAVELTGVGPAAADSDNEFLVPWLLSSGDVSTSRGYNPFNGTDNDWTRLATFTLPTDQSTIPWAQFTAVPVPAAVWLFGSGLIGLVGIARRKKAA